MQVELRHLEKLPNTPANSIDLARAMFSVHREHTVFCTHGTLPAQADFTRYCHPLHSFRRLPFPSPFPPRPSSILQGMMSREPKGGNFKPGDDFLLSKCWVVGSQRVKEQNAETFWARVAADFDVQPSTILRFPASLMCRWTTLQKVTQKYPAADELYRSNVPSGETEEDTKAHVMQLYRKRNGTVDKGGTKKLAAPVKFLMPKCTCHLIQKFPPLSANYLLQPRSTVLPARPI